MKLTDAQIARVKELETARGEITPRAVVEDAKDKASPLHSLFEWTKAKAAEIHWLHVAREVIGAVHVVVTTTEHTIKAPMYVRDMAANGQGYRSVTALRQDPESARQSLVYTLEVAAGHIRRAQDIAAPLGLQGEVDQLLAQILGVQRMIKKAA
jgi:uncharacterized protein YigE (DUF2233 family)